MKNNTIPNISLIQMRYFIEVVKHNSFTNASENLNIVQSTISKNIALLEQNLGIQLFIRNNKRLHLTDAGYHLYKEWKIAFNLIENSIEECRILDGGYLNTIKIGVLDSHKLEGFILPSIKIFKEKYLNVNIHVESFTSQEIRSNLINGNIDVVFTVLYDVEQLCAKDFSYKIIEECYLGVSMLKTNSLAKKESLKIDDLINSNFISISPLHTQSYVAMLKSACENYNFHPNFTCYVSSANSLIYNLKSENDIFICDKFYRGLDNDYVYWCPLEDMNSGIVIAWQNSNKKRQLKAFINIFN